MKTNQFELPAALLDRLARVWTGSQRITVLTGAGVSAESGIPTFRGPQGYWQVGSRNYKPQEIGTLAMFEQAPDEVWKWYLFRQTVCRAAAPNTGHHAIVKMEQVLGDRFALMTQNVDGLHLRAGNSPERTFHVHGSLEYMRCSVPCTRTLHPFPPSMATMTRETALTDADRAALVCPDCGVMTRPHVLWFDEYYDEDFYRFESCLRLADQTDLLITVGTSGSTNLPNHVLSRVVRDGGTVVDVNPHDNIFGQTALRYGGFALQGSSGDILPAIADALARLKG
ncbi:MAG: NAD-dependent deacetylase [Bradymonadia bacterium]|jgi:NAD-dependent deacetylase